MAKAIPSHYARLKTMNNAVKQTQHLSRADPILGLLAMLALKRRHPREVGFELGQLMTVESAERINVSVFEPSFMPAGHHAACVRSISLSR